MQRIKLVEDVTVDWPEGTSRIVDIFADNNLDARHEDAAKLLTMCLKYTCTTSDQLKLFTDQQLFLALEPYYYVDNN